MRYNKKKNIQCRYSIFLLITNSNYLISSNSKLSKLKIKDISVQESSSNWEKYYINIVYAINFILVWKLTLCQVASEHQ